MSKPWTWEGAPEFKDWTFHGSQSTEIALLRIQSFETEIILGGVFRDEEGQNILVVKVTDSEGLNWSIHFDAKSRGIACSIVLESNLSLQYLFGCRECDEEATPQCPVVGILAVKNEKLQTHVFIDFVHVFSAERPKSTPLLFWNETLGTVADKDDQVKIKLEMRILRQHVPY